MRVLKPPWVNHDGKPIYSIDVHPDGSRFATAGQGDSSGRITIWNVLPISDANQEKNPIIPRMLCQMDNHFACVNCVRWSNNGTWLASAGDDKLIMIWRYAGGASKTFGSEQENTETWRCIHTLRGHSGDVLDLAWSPQDKYLATCSVDNSVVIWNAQKFPDQIKVLKGHTSMVKGVTWDPIGKYLATQSDDKTLIVWRTADWQQEKTVTEPFKEAGGTTHALRLGWSPDGSYMVSAHAMNNMGPTAQIISRSGWSTDMDFVGHRKAVSCVRFNPKLLSRKVKKGNKEKWVNYCCCAVGSRDCSCSIWLTALRRPLVVLHDLFDNSVIDMAWNTKGTQLFICSSDGTMAFVEFTQDEIGRALAEEEKTKLLCKMYGNSVVMNGSAPTKIIENAELLKLHQQNISNCSVKSNSHMNGTIPAPGKQIVNGFHTPKKDDAVSNLNISSSTMNTPSKQIETRTKDGRRRITPIFLSPPPAVSDAVPLQPVFTSTNKISEIVIEHASSEDASLFARPLASDSRSPVRPADTSTRNKPSEGNKDTEAEPAETMATMQPMSSAEAKAATPMKSKTSSSGSAESTKSKPSTSKPETEGQQKDKEVVNKIAVKRKAPPPQASKKTKKDSSASQPAENVTPSSSQVQTRPQIIQQVVPATKTLSVREVKKTFSHQHAEADWSINLTVTNSIQPSGGPSLSSLHAKLNTGTWSAMFSHPVLDIQANKYLVCVACKHRSLSVYNLSGHRLLPDIILDSDISHLSVNRHHCLCITSHAKLSLWDFESMQCTVSSLDISHLLTADLSLSQCFLTESSLPCVKLSNNDTLFYHTSLKSWLSFKRSDDSVPQYCNQDSVRKPATGTDSDQDKVAALSNKLHLSSASLSRVYKSDNTVQQGCTLSHIQNQMALCKAMNSQSEFRGWLLAYIRYLTKHDDESNLRQLCSHCTKIVYKSKRGKLRTRTLESTSEKNSHNDHTIENSHQTAGISEASNHTAQSVHTSPIMNLDGKELLADMLPIIGSNLNLQRLYTEFSDLLDIMKSGLG